MLNSLPVGFDKLCRPLKLEGKDSSVEDLWPGVCLVRKLSVRHYGEGFEVKFRQDPFGDVDGPVVGNCVKDVVNWMSSYALYF